MASFNTHDLGDLIRVSGVFSEQESGDTLDPDAVYLSVRNPDGEVTTYTYGTDPEIVNDSTGHYHADIDADAAGNWHYRWWSTGTGQAAEEKRFKVSEALAVEDEE